MRSLRFLFAFALCGLLTAVAHAVPRPTVKEWQADEFKIGELTMEKFFEARRTKDECREKLEARKVAFENAKKAVAELQAKGAPKEAREKAEKAMIAARLAYLNMMDIGGKEKDPESEEMKPVAVCGDCHVPELKAIQVDQDEEGKPLEAKETWFVSHGYCSAQGLNEKEFLEAMPKIVEWLRTPEGYAKKAGGFRHVLTSVVIDDTKKAVVKNAGLQKGNEFHLFMGVRADILGNAFATFSYYIKNLIEEKNSDDNKQRTFNLTFGTVPRGALVPPKVEDVDVMGEPVKPLMARDLTLVIGWWHADAKNRRFRYSTATILPKDLAPLAASMTGEGRRTHLETVTNFADRFFQKANRKTMRGRLDDGYDRNDDRLVILGDEEDEGEVPEALE